MKTKDGVVGVFMRMPGQPFRALVSQGPPLVGCLPPRSGRCRFSKVPVAARARLGKPLLSIWGTAPSSRRRSAITCGRDPMKKRLLLRWRLIV